MIKGSWIYCPSHMFSKTCIFPYFDIISHLFSFWNPFPPPTSPPFFQLYLQSKTFLNIQSIPSGAVFCNNAMLTTISSSIILLLLLLDLYSPLFFCASDMHK